VAQSNNSHDVTAAIMASQTNELVVMLVYQTNSVAVELVSYENNFLCMAAGHVSETLYSTKHTNLSWSCLLSLSFSSASLFVGFLFSLPLKNCRYKHNAKLGVYPCNNGHFYGLGAQVDVFFANYPYLHRKTSLSHAVCFFVEISPSRNDREYPGCLTTPGCRVRNNRTQFVYFISIFRKPRA